MVEQRERRYMKPLLRQLLKNKDPSLVIEGSSYDTNNITPGTRLMALLNEEFEKAISAKKFKNVAVVFDGSNIPGEAEHKYLKIMDGLIDNPGENHVVFSGDGDVIFLSLKYPKKNIFIMQSVANSQALKNFFPPTQEFAYLDVKKLGQSYYDIYSRPQYGGRILSNNEKLLLKTLTKNVECEMNNKENKVDISPFLIDFVFLSFMEGNDFTRPIYFLNFNQDKMRTLLGIYQFQKKISSNSNFRLINKDMTINQTFLLNIFKRLGNIQTERFEEIKRQIEKKISFPPIKKNNQENVFEHKFFSNQDHHLHSQYVQQYEQLFGDMTDFHHNYYTYFFGSGYNVNSICEKYLQILQFNLNYYFGIEVSWNICYNEVVAPLPSDLAIYLESHPGYFKTLKIDEGSPVHPFIVLAYVLPPQSMTEGTIPKKYKDLLLKKYPEYFPDKISLKLLQPGGKMIYTKPHLDNPPLSILEEALKKIKLTKEEKDRNELKTEPVIYIKK